MTTQVVFKIDPAVKKEAMKRAKREGIPFASVLKMAAKAYADGRFSVDIQARERLNAKTLKKLHAIHRDIVRGKNLSPEFTSAEEMDKYLGI
ncbi:hypothetical protein HY417_00925 [Candidatus Kaiserbacteria bacterium]|nr:hypothetical protein [Candidatus Kaiserbacteria bacterium]